MNTKKRQTQQTSSPDSEGDELWQTFLNLARKMNEDPRIKQAFMEAMAETKAKEGG